jgi:SAM-dependent methyltransferase
MKRLTTLLKAYGLFSSKELRAKSVESGKPDYTHVTEVTGEAVSREQIERMLTRYHWARSFCQNREVLELACGSGQGLGYLAQAAKRIVGGDYSGPLLRTAGNQYQGRIPLLRLDAQAIPFQDHSFDVVILYEAIYYLPDRQAFARECYRVLRHQGVLLLCTANKDLPDFNPSPYSFFYPNPSDFVQLLSPLGFQIECFAESSVDYANRRQKILSGIKKTMVRFNLMPKTMAGKKIFKRIVFGKLVPLPPELAGDMGSPQPPSPIACDRKDTNHKVIFVLARKGKRVERPCLEKELGA